MSDMQERPPRRRGGCGRRLLIFVLIIAAILALGWGFVARPIRVPGDARDMSPALRPGARVWLDKLSYHILPPHRGDIVAVASPSTGGGLRVARIVALPGDAVSARDGKLLIDGAAVAESYAHGSLPGSFEPIRVPQAHYFVLPDQRAHAPHNPRTVLVSRGAIIGKVVPPGA
jgi:signal peptidase I